MSNPHHFQIGDRVTVRVPATAPLAAVAWWPKGEVTGTVQKLFKNGKVAVAIDQIRNRSADGCHTMHLSPEWLEG